MPYEEESNQEQSAPEQLLEGQKPRDQFDKIIAIVVVAVSLIFLCSFLYKILW
jgi:hypothetical protein